MSGSFTAPEDARLVADLLARRGRYAAWLAELAERTAGAPPHVAARVRADYEARLAEVRAALAPHAAAIARERDAAAARVAEARTLEQGRRDERAEAELRHLVGELDAADWERRAREADDALAAATTERAAAEAALAVCETALAEVGGAPAAALPPAPVVPPGVAPPPPPLPFLPGAPLPAPPPSPASTGAPAVPARPSRAIRGTEAFDDLEFIRSLAAGAPTAPRRGTGAQPRPSGAVAREPAAPGDAVEPAPAPQAAGEGAPSAAVGEPSAPVPRTTAAPAARTLRCGSCGAPNVPTEWYCQRCGGELAAM